jgi:Aerotolerance regulator N-terminal
VSFLAPIFLLGSLAILGPIVFHMIRRQAKGEQVFSSLMFLEPSPPTMMRRSRIDQWLLLALRSLAVLLLVAAFARPFLPSLELVESTQSNIRRAILLDVSASMNRDPLWSTAIEKTKSIIENSKEEHILSLYVFDREVRSLLSESEAQGHSANERRALLLAALENVKPTYFRSNLGTALTTVADRLTKVETNEDHSTPVSSEIVLVSDFQAGSDVDRLENFQWPSNCRVTIEQIRESDENQADNSNVAATTLESKSSEAIPIRLVHRQGIQTKSIEVEWLDENGKSIATSSHEPGSTSTSKPLANLVKVELPVETTVVVEMPKFDEPARILEIRGDVTTFDNRRWFSKPPIRELQIVCIDDEQRPTPESLGYFLKQLPLDNDARRVQFAWRSPNSSDPWPDLNQVPLVVASHLLTIEDAKQARNRVENGGHFLWALDKSVSEPELHETLKVVWNALTNDELVDIREAATEKESIWEKIDFTHPLFQTLADSRFNDFTKTRFWQHRRIELPATSAWKTIASFDDRSPALACRSHGKGKFWLMTSGWQPAESQFALSSKFVPIMAGIFQDALPSERDLSHLVTGDRIQVEADEVWKDASNEALPSIQTSEGEQVIEFTTPGFYRVSKDNVTQTVAVNLPGTESDTRPMEIEKLERLGVVTKASQNEERMATKEQQRKSIEIEKDQRLWRWFMIGMLGVIVVESLWCSRA